MRHPIILLPALLLAATGLVGFHDFWISPESFEPKVGEELEVQLLVGHLGDGTPYARNPGHIARFVAVTDEATLRVRGRPGATPAGRVTFDVPGLVVLGYESRASRTELDGPGFEAYLEEEGLDAISRIRAQRGETDQAAREAFRRCAKALVRVGGQGEDGFDRRLGLPLELTPEQNPYALAVGDSLSIRLEREGQPLADARVTAVSAAGASSITLQTDADGRVRFRVDQSGVWLIKHVYMEPASDDPRADWSSYWATLTFIVPY